MIDGNSKRVIGYLQKAIRPLNMLRQIEDAVVIYRISRAPERRIFYIDVGNLPKNKEEQKLLLLMVDKILVRWKMLNIFSEKFIGL